MKLIILLSAAALLPAQQNSASGKTSVHCTAPADAEYDLRDKMCRQVEAIAEALAVPPDEEWTFSIQPDLSLYKKEHRPAELPPVLDINNWVEDPEVDLPVCFSFQIWKQGNRKQPVFASRTARIIVRSRHGQIPAKFNQVLQDFVNTELSRYFKGQPRTRAG